MVQFSVNTQAETVNQGDTVQLAVVAEWPQSEGSYNIYTPQLEELSGARIKDHISFGEAFMTVSDALQRVVHCFTLVITNPAETIVETGRIAIRYRHAANAKPQNTLLSGISMNVVPASSSFPYVIAGAGALLAVIGGAFATRHTRRKHVSHSFSRDTQLEDAYLVKLEKAQKLRLEGDTAGYFHAIEDLIRGYMREKYHIGNIETWSARLNGPVGPDDTTIDVARQLLKLSHSVRYADYEPAPYDFERMYSFLHAVCQNNKPETPIPADELYITEETYR